MPCSPYSGDDDRNTQLLAADLATGKIELSTTVTGQVTSAVPTGDGIAGVQGNRLVSVSANGKTDTLGTVTGDAYELRPTADGGVSFLQTQNDTSTAVHLAGHKATPFATGSRTRLHLFQGRAGKPVLVGASTTSKADVTSVSDRGLARGASGSSLDGDALAGPDADDQKAAPVLLATKTSRVLGRSRPASTQSASTGTAAFVATKSTVGTAEVGTPQPRGDAAPSGAAPTAAAAQTPVCAVPRLSANRQVMQPNPAQVNWAIQMAEQGLLTGSTYTRPAGFANLGLAAYAPNSDFPLIPLSHPASDGWNTVPRSVYEAIVAQESNWSQASWHAPAGTAGGPLVADYYGAGGDIRSINYAGSDCGYGLGQVTNGMHVGDHIFSVNGQTKVAVDYQENLAAGLQILESTWNQLYTAGITANNASPRYLENWYFAAWAYNSGIQPNAANGNTSGCTPSPTCTGPHGTWGLGWTNNPANLDYPPSRDPYLQDTYADAAHPGSWPYQERVLGWMASPLLRYGSRAYAKADYHGGKTWVQPAPFTSFCTSANFCDPNATNPTVPGASHCMLNDFQCWWHQPTTWISDCTTTCSTSAYTVGAGSGEPANPSQNPPTCSLDNAKVPANAIIVDNEPSRLNVQGCGSANWSSNGTFTYAYGTNAAGDPIGAIDTHQLGTGLGGHILFSHTEDGTEPHGPNGSLAADGPFGWGWTHSYNLSTTTDAATGNVIVRQEDGSAVTFLNSGGTYAPSAPRFDAALVKNGGNYVYTRYGPDGGLTAGQTLVTDPAGHKDLQTYQNGLLVSETKGYGTPDAGTASYTYDPVTLGVTTQTDADGHVQTFTYDDHGHRTSASDALGFTTNYVYDNAGNVVETIDPNGVATVNGYD